MKKIAIYTIFLVLIFGCSKNYCGFIENNEESLSELLLLIEENPEEFSNTQSLPRTYYTYNYKKNIFEFKKTKSSKNINTNEHKVLKDIFDKYSIEKLIIFDRQNILFKIKNNDFFIINYNIYIGHLKEKPVEEIKEYFEIMDYKNCVSEWYYLTEKTSIAN